MSANLKNGGADPDIFAGLVRSLSVDMLAVQEVSHDQAQALSDLFEHGEIDPDHNYVGMGLLSRHPIAVERIPMTWGFGQTARLLPRDFDSLREPVDVTNLHIAAPHMHSPWPGPYLRWRQAGELAHYLSESDRRETNAKVGQGAQPPRNANCSVMSSNNAMEESRGHGAPELPGVRDLGVSRRPGPSAPVNLASPDRRREEAALCKSSGPARVLVGDFNATPYWPWYRRMVSQFTDAAVTVAEKSGEPLKPTWGPWPGSPKVLRIDHGFLRRVDAEGFEVFDVVGSDHCALVMDLTLPV